MKAFNHPLKNLTVRRLAQQPLKAEKPNPKILTDLFHEVRGHLTVILLSCDMLCNTLPGIQSEEQLNHIEQSSRKIHELIKGIPGLTDTAEKKGGKQNAKPVLHGSDF